MPACPLLTLRRPPHEGPTHNSGSWLIAIHYHMEDLHLLLFAGFYRRFLGVPLLSPAAFLWASPCFPQGISERRDATPIPLNGTRPGWVSALLPPSSERRYSADRCRQRQLTLLPD
jgi:hypothetical protein